MDGQYRPKRGDETGNDSREYSINERSISFVAEVNAAIGAHRLDTPGMEARASRHSMFALTLVSHVCTLHLHSCILHE